MTMIEAVIFDMDGLLIDSEPLWQEAEIAVFNKVGVPLTLEMTHQTTGLRVDEVVKYWHKRHPWKTPSQKEVAQRIDDAVLALVKERGVAKPGVQEAITVCKEAGLPMAVASSSARELIKTVLQKLGIAEYIDIIHSAHDEEYGKPHPAVYIRTATTLKVHVEHCLAFEDSVNGVLSAKAAKMKCIAIPEPGIKNDKRYGIADRVLNSLEDFDAKLLRELGQ